MVGILKNLLKLALNLSEHLSMCRSLQCQSFRDLLHELRKKIVSSVSHLHILMNTKLLKIIIEGNFLLKTRVTSSMACLVT